MATSYAHTRFTKNSSSRKKANLNWFNSFVSTVVWSPDWCDCSLLLLLSGRLHGSIVSFRIFRDNIFVSVFSSSVRLWCISCFVWSACVRFLNIEELFESDIRFYDCDPLKFRKIARKNLKLYSRIKKGLARTKNQIFGLRDCLRFKQFQIRKYFFDNCKLST